MSTGKKVRNSDEKLQNQKKKKAHTKNLHPEILGMRKSIKKHHQYTSTLDQTQEGASQKTSVRKYGTQMPVGDRRDPHPFSITRGLSLACFSIPS